jgi:hypothetical protein
MICIGSRISTMKTVRLRRWISFYGNVGDSVHRVGHDDRDSQISSGSKSHVFNNVRIK